MTYYVSSGTLNSTNSTQLPSENENITFHTFNALFEYYTLHIKQGMKHKVHQVQRKQIDSHKVC